MNESTNNDGLSNKPKIEIKPKIIIHGQSNSEVTSNPELKIIIKDVVYNKIEFNGRIIDWFRQRNGWDCGPCMCLNMQDLLNAKNNSDAASDVDNFRSWAENNTFFMKDRRTLQNGQILKSSERLRYTRDMDNEWLRMEDVRNYIKDVLDLKEIAIEDASNLKTLIENNSKNRDMFIWGVSSNHYRGYFIGKDGGSVYSVDSFKNGPEISRIDDVSNFVGGATGTCFIAVGSEPKITVLNQNR